MGFPSALPHQNEQPADLVAELPASENKKFYPALDGLRAVAVLMVFYAHYDPNPKPSLNWGWTGVSAFFVLSGFLITGILYDTRNTAHRFRNFYIRRSLRIFPLYYGVLLIVFALYPMFRWVWHPAWLMWPVYLNNYSRFIWQAEFLKGTGIVEQLRSSRHVFHDPFYFFLGHFWSLAAEEQFYLIWPLIVFFAKDRVKLRNICLSVCVLTPLARLACCYLLPHSYIDSGILYTATPFRADGFLLGGLFALMLRGPEARWLGNSMRPAFYCLIVGVAVTDAIYKAHMHHFIDFAYTPASSSIGCSIINLLYALLILLALEPGSFFYRLFTVRPLRLLGQMSYGFYVFHDIPHDAYILLVKHTYKAGPWFNSLVALVAFATTLALSYMSYRFYETRFLRLKDRFAP